LDHFLDHLPADRTGLTGRQIAVVALLEVYPDFACGFHLEAVKSVAGFGYERLSVSAGHIFISVSLFSLPRRIGERQVMPASNPFLLRCSNHIFADAYHSIQ
jgi:hypothetical protein